MWTYGVFDCRIDKKAKQEFVREEKLSKKDKKSLKLDNIVILSYPCDSFFKSVRFLKCEGRNWWWEENWGKSFWIGESEEIIISGFYAQLRLELFVQSTSAQRNHSVLIIFYLWKANFLFS